MEKPKVVKFRKLLEDINSIFMNIYNREKNVKSNWCYINGKFYNYDQFQFPQFVEVKILDKDTSDELVSKYNIPKMAKDQQLALDYLKQYDFYMNSAEFFSFVKENKTNIKDFDIIDNSILFYNENKEVIFSSSKKFNMKYINLNEDDLLGSFELKDEMYGEILENKNFPFTVILDLNSNNILLNTNTDSDSYLEFKLNKKFLVNFKNTKTIQSKISANIYSTKKDNVYDVEFIIFSKNIATHSVFRVIDYNL